MKVKPKIGIVDVGGGFRGIYAAGVLDYCMHKGIWFDLGIGVSAGSANIASYCARQPLRNHKFYTEYGLRKEYMSAGNYLRKGSYLDLEYVYGTLTNSDGEYPIDYDTLMASPMELLIVATDARTGNATYIPKQELIRDHYTAFMASSAIPGLCRPIYIDGIPYYDGAPGDPVPVEKAFEMGCDKVVLILTMPEDTLRTPYKDQTMVRFVQRKFPETAKVLRERASKYNRSIELAKQYRTEGKLLIIAPDDTCGVHTLCRDSFKMRRLYGKGYVDAEKITPFLLG